MSVEVWVQAHWVEVLGRQAPRLVRPWLGGLARLVVCTALVAGWVQPSAAADKAPASGAPADVVLATVNGTAITQREVDSIFKKTAPVQLTAAQAALRKRAILAELVRTEVLAQDAIAKGLNKADELALEARLSQRQLLAGRAEEDAGAMLPPMQLEEARQLVARSPLLFAQRRQYTIEEVRIVTADPDLFEKLDKEIRQNGLDLDGAQRKAVELGAAVERRVVAVPSEGLPAALVEPFSNARPGQLWVVRQAVDQGAILAMRASIPAPLVGEQAVEAAINVGTQIRRRQAALLRTQDIVNRARISYTDAAEALSAPAVAQAASSAGLAAAPAASGASAAGPITLSPDPLVELPRGLVESASKILARKLLIVLGFVIVGLSVLMIVWGLIRYAFGRFWLPHLWPLRAPVVTPSILQIVAESVIHPSTGRVKWGELTVKALMVGGLLGCGVLMAMAASASFKHVPNWWVAGALLGGWLLGIVASHAVARARARTIGKDFKAWPVFGWQGLVLLACAPAIRLL